MLISDIKKGERVKLHKIEGFAFYGYMANQLELENSSSQEGMIQIVAGDNYIAEAPADVLAIKDALQLPAYEPDIAPVNEEKDFLVELAKTITAVLEGHFQETMKLPESLLKEKDRAVKMLREFYSFFFSTEDIDLLYQDALLESGISEEDFLNTAQDFTVSEHQLHRIIIHYDLPKEAHELIAEKFGPILVPSAKLSLEKDSFLLTISK